MREEKRVAAALRKNEAQVALAIHREQRIHDEPIEPAGEADDAGSLQFGSWKETTDPFDKPRRINAAPSRVCSIMPISTRQATIAVDNCDDILILGEPPPYYFAKRLGDPLGGCEIACLPFREVGQVASPPQFSAMRSSTWT